jgi:cytidylate kinase
MSVVTVTVLGPVGSGKSAICGEIEIALRAIGVNVTWPEGHTEKNLTYADWHDALDLYQPTVEIREELGCEYIRIH